MSNRYQVMFVWKDETRFGIVDTYSDEAKKYAKQGKLLISDAVRPAAIRGAGRRKCRQHQDGNWALELAVQRFRGR